MKKRLMTITLSFCLMLLGLVGLATPASAAPGNILPPFSVGETWNICQGYSNPAVTHTGTSQYGLDLTGGGCGNSAAGRTVRAPANGTVYYYQASYGNLCVNIPGGKSYTLTHIDSPISSGTVTAGQAVGTVAGAGLRGNNGVAHIHFQMWSTPNCYSSAGIPFDSSNGARICGAPDLTASGPSSGNGAWSGTQFTGGTCGSGNPPSVPGGNGSDIAVFEAITGGLVAFARGTDGQLYNSWQTGPGSGWVPFQLVTSGVIAGSPAIVKHDDGTFSAYALSTSGRVLTSWQTGPGGAWTSWAPLESGGMTMAGMPVVHQAITGGLVAFARGTDGQLYNSWQTGPGSGWVPFQTVTGGGGLAHQPAVFKHDDGSFSAYAINGSGRMLTSWQTGPGGAWTSWAPLESGGMTVAGTPVIERAITGGLVAFARGTDGQLYNSWQTGPGTGWVPFQTVAGGGSLASSPTIYKDANGVFTAFAVNTNGAVVTSWQAGPGGAWTSWTSIGGGVFTQSVRPTIHQAITGGLVAFARGTDGQLYNSWQTGPGSGWVPFELVVGGFALSS